MSDSPHHILLPSSYYRLSGSQRKSDDNTKCSVVSERVSNESSPEWEACSSSSKSVGQNASGCNKGRLQ
ncbi:unnamed protein product [Miscanthus lutarioriparius]|uniref:Uncharacterized protein n=1 Tax=Miscanthus lutarioriparius TaxID=422564 RepID=A0A811RRR2_9POAL|nr:unnamed protein product [Miscanthus lutarioriparius]